MTTPDMDALRKSNVNKAAGGTDERGTTWKPKNEGDELAGTIKTINYVHTDYGDKYVLNIVDETDPDKLWTLWVDGAVIQNRLLELAPGVGSLIVVIFEGKLDNKAGTYKYNAFQVSVSKPNCHDEWIEVKAAYDRRQLLKNQMNAARNAPGVSGDDASAELEAPF